MIDAIEKAKANAGKGNQIAIAKEWRGKTTVKWRFAARRPEDLPEEAPGRDTDFARFFVVGASLGGYYAGPTIEHRIDIQRVEEHEGAVLVLVSEVVSETWYKVHYEQPRPDHFHVVRIPAVDKPVHFIVNRTETDIPPK